MTQFVEAFEDGRVEWNFFYPLLKFFVSYLCY